MHESIDNLDYVHGIGNSKISRLITERGRVTAEAGQRKLGDLRTFM